MVKENGTVMGTRTDYDIEGILEVATEESLDDRVEDDDVKKAFADARANGKSVQKSCPNSQQKKKESGLIQLGDKLLNKWN